MVERFDDVPATISPTVHREMVAGTLYAHQLLYDRNECTVKVLITVAKKNNLQSGLALVNGVER